ncbi:MAG: serine hydrolase [Saprospiraceae bacterium]
MRLILIFLLFISLQSSAQLDSALIQQFETTFQEYGNANQIIGMSIAIRSADDVWTGQYGVSGVSEPLTEDHLFAMGSVSKTITSATILQMYEDGLLSLGDPLSEYLATYANVDSTVTIRQLLNHTSGIYNYTNHPSFFNDVLSSNQPFLSEKILTDYLLTSEFVAGTDWSYSNTNYVLLGMIIEAISGKTYYEEARERFDFDTNYPSFVTPPFEISPNELAHLWADFDGSGMTDAQTIGLSLVSLFSAAGAGGIYAATPKDLTRWAKELYSGTILQPATMELLLTPARYNSEYGLGVIIADNRDCPMTVLGHTGGIGYATATFYDAENDLSVSVHTNDAETNANMMGIALDMMCINRDFVSSTSEAIDTESFSVFPNPFSDQVVLSYELTNSRNVNITLLDNTGRRILNIDRSKQSAGLHEEVLNTDLPAGMYVLQLRLDDQIIHKKIVKN